MTTRVTFSRNRNCLIVGAMLAGLLPGCSVTSLLPGYIEAPTASTQAPPPDLISQEAFAADLETIQTGTTLSNAEIEALLARAARLEAWAQQ